MKAFGDYSLARQTHDTINFYNRHDDYYEFTNFYPHRVYIDDHIWPTTEHYFQAQKFVGTPYYDHIRKLPFPREAFSVSRDPVASRWIRGDWIAVKDNVMLKALRVKFEDPVLKKLLLSTGNKRLVEHTANDSYWGDGGDGRGLNMLGKLLMKVRNEIRNSETETKRITHRSSTLKRSSSCSSLADLHVDNSQFGLNRKGSVQRESCISYLTDYRTPVLTGTPVPTRRGLHEQSSSGRKIASFTPKPARKFYSRDYDIINHLWV